MNRTIFIRNRRFYALIIFVSGLLLFQGSAMAENTPAPENPVVLMTTSAGEIRLELYTDKAPMSVENFLTYVSEQTYDGTIFHRVIDGFMIQGGGFDAAFSKVATRPPIRNEANNALANNRGTIAMARTSDPHSATNQFFINVADNAFLNYSAPTTSGWGYTVFGRVIGGMDTVDKIKSVATGRSGPFPQDVPLETVTIESVRVVDTAKDEAH